MLSLLLLIAGLVTCGASLSVDGGFESYYWLSDAPGVFYSNMTLEEPSDLVGALVTFPAMFDVVSIRTNMQFSPLAPYNNTYSFNMTGRFSTGFTAWLVVTLVVPAGRPFSWDGPNQASYCHTSTGKTTGSTTSYSVPRISPIALSVLSVSFSGSDLQETESLCGGYEYEWPSMDVNGYVSGWDAAKQVIVSLHYDASALQVRKDGQVFDDRFECNDDMTTCKASQPLPLASSFFLRFRVTHTDSRCVASAADFLSSFVEGANLDASTSHVQVFGLSTCQAVSQGGVNMFLGNTETFALTYNEGAFVSYNVSFSSASSPGISARFFLLFPTSSPFFNFNAIITPQGVDADCLSFESSSVGNMISCVIHNITTPGYDSQIVRVQGWVEQVPKNVATFSPSLTHIGCLNTVQSASWVSQETIPDQFIQGDALSLQVSGYGGFIFTPGSPIVDVGFSMFGSYGPGVAEQIEFTLVAPTTAWTFLNVSQDEAGRIPVKECSVSLTGSRIACHIPEMRPSSTKFNIWYHFRHDGSKMTGLVKNRVVAKSFGEVYSSVSYDPVVCE